MMARFITVIFIMLTVVAAYLTYRNIGMEETYFDEKSASVRSGSYGGSFNSGGYDAGK